MAVRLAHWAIALALLAGSAFPVASALPGAGVWQGSVGILPIRACFADEGRFGAYFYTSKLKSIALQATETANGQYYEGGGDGKGAPRWTLERADEGRWTSGAKALPIRLTRVAGAPAEETPCASLAFHAPRLVGIRVIDTPAVSDGLHYVVRRLDLRGRFEDSGVQTIALPGSTSAIRRINRTLAEPLGLGSGGPQAADWFDCLTGSLDSTPYEGQSNQEIALRMATARYVTVMDHTDYSCGGAHPDSVDRPRIFDLRNGREIDLHDWFNDRALKGEPVGHDVLVSIRPAFRQLLLARWKPADDECRNAIETEDIWSVELTRVGFTFTPQLPHVAAGCVESFPFPFARLAPYLNAAGTAGVAALNARG